MSMRMNYPNLPSENILFEDLALGKNITSNQ